MTTQKPFPTTPRERLDALEHRIDAMLAEQQRVLDQIQRNAAPAAKPEKAAKTRKKAHPRRFHEDTAQALLCAYETLFVQLEDPAHRVSLTDILRAAAVADPGVALRGTLDVPNDARSTGVYSGHYYDSLRMLLLERELRVKATWAKGPPHPRASDARVNGDPAASVI